MKKPLVKTQNPIKKGFSAVKARFFPTPEQMVAEMKRSNSYPSGRAYWQIAPKIIKNGTLAPQEKASLLLDLYGKYYIYQQQKCVNFAVYENYYEEFVYPRSDGTVYKNQGRYEKLYNEMVSENSYIINRSVRDGLEQIMAQAQRAGMSRTEFADSLDPRAQSILYLSAGLPDDFEDKKVFNVYIPSKEEDYIKELLCERFFETHPEHLDAFRQQAPFAEFMSDVAKHKPLTPPAFPSQTPAYKDGVQARKGIAEEVKEVTTETIKSVTSDKLPEQ